MKRAFVFPGQGSQKVGMGKELAAEFAIARETFEEVDEALGERLSHLIFEGSQEQLTLTENAQPAIMAASIALWRVLQQECDFSLPKDGHYVAGHSLGEYSALVASGALQLRDTARLLRLRGKAMQAAVPVGEGAMAAIIGLEPAEVKEVVREASTDNICVIANINSHDQVVISGIRANVMRAMELAKARGAKRGVILEGGTGRVVFADKPRTAEVPKHGATTRAILLDVSAPFHSPLMQPAAQAMHHAFQEVAIRKPLVPVVSNVTAKAERAPEAIATLMVEQVTSAVRWMECIQYLAKHKVTEIVEVGPGNILTNLSKRINPTLYAYSISSSKDFGNLMTALHAHHVA